MAGRKQIEIPQGMGGAEAYDLKRAREAARNASHSEEGRDIGELPQVDNPKRRARALKDPEFFCLTYFPKRFKLKMSDDQRASLLELKRVAEEGGCKAFAAPRGDGKTTRAEVMTIWAILTGKKRFIAFIGATAAAARESLDSIKGEFETNELLLADFPEVCYPVHALGGIAQKCKGQRYQGQPTHMKWSDAGAMCVLPTIPGSLASGAVFCCRGIVGRIRGMKYRRADGETIRPDMAIVDDPQTMRSALSHLQCQRRLNTITGDVLGLAGPGVSMACFVPCTVIVRGDLADQILDTDKFAAFQGVRNKLVYAWPTETKLWEEYADLRRQSMRTYGDGRLGTAHYKKHQRTMDAGCKVAWLERKEKGELSAIQNAYNLRIDRAATFDAEYQNEPRDPASDDEKLMTPAEVEAKVSGLERLMVFLAGQYVTAFIDIQHNLLYYAVCAWSPEFNGSCIDYGTWPDQGRNFFLYRDAGKTLATKFPGAGKPGAIRGGLDALIDELAKREYKREDDAILKVSRIFVDSGDSTKVVYGCYRESSHKALLRPTKGMGITSDKVPISEWKKKDGQLIGEEWMWGKPNNSTVQVLSFDTNYWKTQVHRGLSTVAGDRGCFTLFGKNGTDHQMIANHLTAEGRTKTFGRGRPVFVWKERPDQPDNHFFDCIVGNHVAASQLGCRLIGQPRTNQQPKPRPRPRVSPLKC